MSSSLFRKRDALTAFLLMEGAAALFFALIFTVNMVYQVTVVGLNPLQLVLVGTLLETVAFLFEIPTGVVADSYSRRLSVILGMALIGLGFMIEVSVPRFEVVLLAQLFWGLGATFTSGATQAWIADEVGEARAGHAFMRGAQIGMFGGLLGIPLSVALASVSVRLPVALGGALFVMLAGILLIIMPEDGFSPRPAAERESWRSMFRTFREGVQLARGRSILLIFLGVSAVYGLSSEGFDRLWTKHLLENFSFPALGDLDPVVWFGIISAATSLLSITATEIVKRRADMSSTRGLSRLLFAANGLMVLALALCGLAGSFGLVLVAFLVFQVLRSVTGPLVNTWINPHIDSSVRATVFSMAAQLNAVGQIAGGPPIGVIGTRVSLRAALVADALLLAPVLALFGRATRPELVPTLRVAGEVVE